MWEWRTHVTKIFIIAVFVLPRIVFAASDHILISEVQITGGTGATDQDFIELYNPTNQPVDLNGYRLVKRTASGTTDTIIKSWTVSTIIPASGYFLWANTNWQQAGIVADETSSGTLADNNSIALRHGDTNVGDIVDSLGWGSATGVFIKGTSIPTNVGAKQSLERKSGGGSNATDTGNNAEDFFIQATPNPKSTKSVQGAPMAEAVNTPQNTQTLLAGALLINEVFPAPSGGSEWVEIINTTANAIDLVGIVITDAVGPIVTLTGSIPGKSLLAFDLLSAKLNNDGDRVRLMAGTTELDVVSYGKWNDGNIADNAGAIKTNQAVARKSTTDTGNDSQDFAVTQEPTKGLPNIIVQPEVVSRGSVSRPIKTTPIAVMRINELMIDPGDNDVEWIEIYNAGETSVDLALWTLEEGSGTPIKLTGTWMPGQFYVVKDIPGALNNSGDVVILRDEKGEVHDRMSYGSWDDGNRVDNALTVQDPQSLGRRTDGYDTGVDSKDYSALMPTKGVSNAKGVGADALTIPDGTVVISEVNPAGSLPFVELFNTTDSYLRLMGWFLKDANGNQIDLSGAVVLPRGYFAVALDEYSANAKGAITLHDQKRHQKDKITYRGALPGKSYAMVAGDWQWTTPSPDQENTIDPIIPESSPAIAIVKQQAVVSTPARTIPAPKLVPKQKTAPVKPVAVSVLTPIDAISEKLLGRSIRATGIVREKKGNIVTIEEHSKTLRVSLASVNYGAQKVNPVVGDSVTATGILKKSNAGLRIVPWQASQIIVEKPKPPEQKPQLVVTEAPPEPVRTHIPWPAISVAIGSIAASVVIKKGIPIKKGKDYAAFLTRRVKRSREEDKPLPGA